MRAALATLLSAPLLAGCAAPLAVTAFAPEAPAIDPVAFFTGPVESFGVTEDAAGRPIGRFRTASFGQREGDGLVMLQRIAFDDGKREERTWRMRPLGAGRYEVSATDAPEPVVGEVSGNAFHWRYTLTTSRSPLPVGMNQWFYLQPDGTLLNRVSARVLGLEARQITEQFRRLPGRRDPGPPTVPGAPARPAS